MRFLPALLALMLVPLAHAADAPTLPPAWPGSHGDDEPRVDQPGNETEQDPAGNDTTDPRDGDNATGTPDGPSSGWDATDPVLRWGLSAAAVLLLVGIFVRMARR